MRLSRPAAGLALAILVACAQIGEPPGGPPDAAAPRLIGTFPESTQVVAGFKDEAEFRFDEIVSEGNAPNFGLGTGDLEKLIVLSPSERVPEVSWKKSRITVKPREGWQPNRVYRIELLPGVMDLRNNRLKDGRVITFTTGAPIPTRYLTGRVVDWSTAKAQPLAVVEAKLFPDSLIYRTKADSTGRFQFGPLPEGEYVVTGAIDQNNNGRFDPREAFDSVRLAANRDTTGEIWAFKHDTVAARIQALTAHDSMAIAVQFTQQLDPYQTVSTDSVRVRLLPDSIPMSVDTVVTVAIYDSLFRKAPAAADTAVSDSARAARARADSVRQAVADSVARADSLRLAREIARRRQRGEPPPRVEEGPLKTKPPLFDRLVIRLDSAMTPGARYAVELLGVRSVSGIPGRVILGFQVPEKKAPADSTKADSTAARPDSTAARPDSTPARRDSTGRPPAPPARRPPR